MRLQPRRWRRFQRYPFDDPSTTPGDSSITTFHLASGGDINATLSLMKAGDILELETSGTYSFGELSGSGTFGFSTIPSGGNTSHVVIHGNGATVGGGAIGVYLAGKSYIDFDNINFGQSALWNGYLTNADHITFTDCDFYNPATDGSYDCWRALNGSNNLTLTRCSAHSTTDYDAPRAHDGFELWGPVSHVVFTDCIAYDIKSGATVNEGHGFETYGQLAGEICDDVQYINCEAYNTQVGFSSEGGPLSLSHTDIVCDGTSSHDNAFYGYEGIDGSTLYRQNLVGTDNTGNGVSEKFGSVTDL